MKRIWIPALMAALGLGLAGCFPQQSSMSGGGGGGGYVDTSGGDGDGDSGYSPGDF